MFDDDETMKIDTESYDLLQKIQNLKSFQYKPKKKKLRFSSALQQEYYLAAAEHRYSNDTAKLIGAVKRNKLITHVGAIGLIFRTYRLTKAALYCILQLSLAKWRSHTRKPKSKTLLAFSLVRLFRTEKLRHFTHFKQSVLTKTLMKKIGGSFEISRTLKIRR